MPLFRLFLAGFIVFTVAFAFSGCVRYVPPASELEQSNRGNSTVPSNSSSQSAGASNSDSSVLQLAGADEFFNYEKEIQERLKTLQSARRPLLSAQQAGGYVLGIGDVFSVTVFQFPELNQENITVSQDGTVALPLIGDRISVAGKTIPELRGFLEARYRDYIVNPNIIIALKNIQSSQVSISGAVAKPGIYPLRESGMLVSDVLALAGGRTNSAGNRILVMPSPHRAAVDGLPQAEEARAVEIWYEDLIGDVNSNPVVLPVVHGDTIVVPEAGSYEVDGEVNKPGSYSLNKKTTAFSAVASAGGFTYGAKVDEVELIRDIGGGKKALLAMNLEEVALQGKSDLRLRDGDVVRVPTASGRHVQRQIVEAINGIFRGIGIQARP
ncbi:MAG: SLBB domain-containing protein [Bdellovibrionales bacterium]|nr:SLBB domain-containing protein [Bdellovibrionales bacterium]